MVASCHRLFRYNNTIEQMTAHCRRLLLLKHREDKTHKNTTKRIQEKGRSLPSSSRFALSLLTPASTFLLLHFRFKCFLLASSSFQTHKKQNTQKNQKKGGSLPFHFWLPFLPFCFFISVSSTFLWHLLLLEQKIKKTHKDKKNHEEEKICREGRELTFKLLLCPLIFGSYFYPLIFALSFQMISPNIFFFSNRRKKKIQRKKNHREKKM
jgi:hypothetical protein